MGSDDFRYDLYRSAFEEERARRESLRTGLSVPITAVSIVLFGLGNLAGRISFPAVAVSEGGLITAMAEDPAQWLASAGLVAASILIALACWQLWQAERLYRVPEIVDLAEINSTIASRTEEIARLGVKEIDAFQRAMAEARNGLTEHLHELYLATLTENEKKSAFRTRAMQFILDAIHTHGHSFDYDRLCFTGFLTRLKRCQRMLH